MIHLGDIKTQHFTIMVGVYIGDPKGSYVQL